MSPQTLRQIRDIIILTVAGILLLFAQSAYWLNHTIFNKQTFTSIVTPIITSESSRQAIASTVVDKAFEDKPVVNRLIGNNVTALVAGLLGTDLAQQMITSVVDKSYSYLTTEKPQPITIDLIAIKTPLEKITEILENRGTDVAVNPSNIPDSITLFDPSDLPNVYGYSILLLWLGPVFWLSAFFLAALYLHLGRQRYPRRIYTLGGVILFVSFLGLLVGPLLPPPIVAQVQIADLRVVVEQLIAGLLYPFTQQMIITIIVTSFVLIVFSLRFPTLHGAQWVIRKTSDSLSSHKQSTVEEPKTTKKTTAKKKTEAKKK